jgi:FMN phosphatase YigB (HAD superfamily)
VMNKKLVFLFDIDNTLLDNDQVNADLKRYLAVEDDEPFDPIAIGFFSTQTEMPEAGDVTDLFE